MCCAFTGARSEKKPDGINLPAFATSQGSLIVSPATNLNVSDRDTKLGSGLLVCGVTAKTKRSNN